MNKIEEIKKELEKSLGYNFNSWGKGDLQMLEEIVEANNKVVKNLSLCAVSQQRELLLNYNQFLAYMYDNDTIDLDEDIDTFLKGKFNNCG